MTDAAFDIKENIIIVTGGNISLEFLDKEIRENKDSYIIGVDRGLDSLHSLQIHPNLVVGDFDSVDNGIRAIYAGSPGAIVLNPKKDYTDTHVAVLEALKRKPARIRILGATGTRLDHVMGNLALLKLCLLQGVEAVIVDEHNRVRMIDRQFRIRKNLQYGKYISCIPFSDRVEGLTISGFQYNLEKATIIKEETIGISNELREEEGFITLEKGYLLVMETKD